MTLFAPGNSTVPITDTLNNVVDLGGGFGLPILFFSHGQIAPLDLGLLGMPGYNLNIASLDVTIYPTTTAPTSTVTLSIPQPLSPGLSFYSQGLSLFTPNSLPNGQNPFGGLMSNGLTSTLSLF